MSDNNNIYTQATLQNCEEEPIHIIGSIQSYGYLMALDIKSLEVVQLSENVAEFLDQPIREIVGHKADEIFPFALLEHIEKFLSEPNNQNYQIYGFRQHGGHYILTFHIADDYLIIEAEQEEKMGMEESYLAYARLVENFVDDNMNSESMREVCQATSQKLKEITGFNRVMVYRLPEDGPGEVIAETIDKGVHSFLGLKFPASDIPPQARRLYEKQMLRGIWDVLDHPVKIEPELRGGDKKPLDLSHSFLRAISPIHIEYLKNMGVRSSFSISLMNKGKLWGLILCHHTQQPMILDAHQRRSCRFLGNMLSYKLKNMLEDQKQRSFKKILRTTHKINADYLSSSDLHLAMEKNSEKLLKVFESEAYALITGDKLSFSKRLDADWVKALVSRIKLIDDPVFSSNHLKKDLSILEWKEEYPAGLLALTLSRQMGEYMIFFRFEEIQQINWGGKPDFNIQKANLNPRSSFEKYTETIKGKSLPWHQDLLEAADNFRSELVENLLAGKNFIFNNDSIAKSDLRLRLMERLEEMEQKNKQLQNELDKLRKQRRRDELAERMRREQAQVQIHRDL